MNTLIVDKFEELENSKDHSPGTIAYCREEQKMFLMNEDKQWNIIEGHIEDHGLQMSLYDINKQVVEQLAPFDDGKINASINTLNNWRKHNIYMLYGREIGYFSVLINRSKEADKNFGEMVIELLSDISSKIYAIDIVAENEAAIEIWIDYQGEATVLYLFNYEQGMVAFHG